MRIPQKICVGRGVFAVFLFILFLFCGCSRGPGKKWVKEQVRKKFDTYWVYGDRHAKEGTDYTFGKYEMAEGGREGRIHINVHTKIFTSKYYMHCSIPAPRFLPGEHKISFWKDDYGEWRMGEM